MSFINRFLSPAEIVDLVLGVDDGNLIIPAEGFDEGELPFSEVGDGLYIAIRATGERAGGICWPFGDPIATDLVEFARLLVENPRFSSHN